MKTFSNGCESLLFEPINGSPDSSIIRGLLPLLGSMVTSTKINMLSFSSISIFSNKTPASPLTLILKGEFVPWAKWTEVMLILPLFELYTLKYFVVDPIVVNSVSNNNVSEEKLNFASECVNSISFLHWVDMTIIRQKKKKMFIVLVTYLFYSVIQKILGYQ